MTAAQLQAQAQPDAHAQPLSPPHAGRVALVALTPEARSALGGSEVVITVFPFRVGRESRGSHWAGARMVSERRNPGASPSNDLYLPDGEEPLNVSREHFQIERDGAGFALVDRKSTCGTLVEGALVGGETQGGSIPLRDRDVIIAGTSRSPFTFKFRVG